MFDNKKICTDCGGACCKHLPGSAYPEDFGNDFEQVKAALATGRWAIDWWDGDPRNGKDELGSANFVRPAIKGYEGRLYHGAWGGECTFLGPDGCELKSKKRPRECRLLEPQEGKGKCKMHQNCGKQDAAIAWLPFTKYFGRRDE